MNLHNDHIMLKYAQTRQAEQMREAQAWSEAQAGRPRVRVTLRLAPALVTLGTMFVLIALAVVVAVV
jgi:hypothetical protein